MAASLTAVKPDVRLLRITALDPASMLARAQVIGSGDGGGCWLNRGLLIALGHVEVGMLIAVRFNQLGEPVAVRAARTK